MARTPEQFCNEMKIIHPDIEVVGLYTKAVESVWSDVLLVVMSGLQRHIHY